MMVGESPILEIIVAHLGSGASLCALKNGKSMDSTLGFTALDGLCMGTRPGAIDAGVILYLFQSLQLSAKEVETILYKKSGLLGISGISSDMRAMGIEIQVVDAEPAVAAQLLRTLLPLLHHVSLEINRSRGARTGASRAP